MPTDQVQLVVSQNVAAPLSYRVPASAEIEPLSVYAEFDGSGAGSAFVPTLEFVSDSGHVIAQAPVDDSLQVAAGGSANVSWFPRVGGSGGGSSGGVQEMWPTFHDVPLDSALALDDYYGGLLNGWGWVIDNTCVRNGYYAPAAPAVNNYFKFKLNLGPQYSTWTNTWRIQTGPGFGTATVRLLKLAEFDDQRPAGYWANPQGLTSDYRFGSGVFSSPIDTVDAYQAVAAKNVDLLSLEWRIGAAPGTDAMTTPTLAADADGFTTVSTGPGLYQVQVIVDSKNAASSGYDFRISSLVFGRVNGRGDA